MSDEITQSALLVRKFNACNLERSLLWHKIFQYKEVFRSKPIPFKQPIFGVDKKAGYRWQILIPPSHWMTVMNTHDCYIFPQCNVYENILIDSTMCWPHTLNKVMSYHSRIVTIEIKMNQIFEQLNYLIDKNLAIERSPIETKINDMQILGHCLKIYFPQISNVI